MIQLIRTTLGLLFVNVTTQSWDWHYDSFGPDLTGILVSQWGISVVMMSSSQICNWISYWTESCLHYQTVIQVQMWRLQKWSRTSLLDINLAILAGSSSEVLGQGLKWVSVQCIYLTMDLLQVRQSSTLLREENKIWVPQNVVQCWQCSKTVICGRKRPINN